MTKSDPIESIRLFDGNIIIIDELQLLLTRVREEQLIECLENIIRRDIQVIILANPSDEAIHFYNRLKTIDNRFKKIVIDRKGRSETLVDRVILKNAIYIDSKNGYIHKDDIIQKIM